MTNVIDPLQHGVCIMHRNTTILAAPGLSPESPTDIIQLPEDLFDGLPYYSEVLDKYQSQISLGQRLASLFLFYDAALELNRKRPKDEPEIIADYSWLPYSCPLTEGQIKKLNVSLFPNRVEPPRGQIALIGKIASCATPLATEMRRIYQNEPDRFLTILAGREKWDPTRKPTQASTTALLTQLLDGFRAKKLSPTDVSLIRRLFKAVDQADILKSKENLPSVGTMAVAELSNSTQAEATTNTPKDATTPSPKEEHSSPKTETRQPEAPKKLANPPKMIQGEFDLPA